MIGRIGFGFVEAVNRPPAALVEQLRGASASSVTDALGRTGVMDPAIKPLKNGMRLLGPAVTVDLPPADNLMVYKALQLVKPGDVMVVNTGGAYRNAVWGELMTHTALAVGLGGLLVDGMVRDGAANRELGLPIFCRGTIPVSGEKDGPGFVNGVIGCGGTTVRPGDVIVGDDDGITVIPQEQLEAVIDALKRQEESEQKRLEQIASGNPLPGWLDRVLKEKGLVSGGDVKGVSE